MLAEYQIAVIDPNTGTQLDLLPSSRIHALQYKRKINDFGNMTLTVLGSDNVVQYGQQVDLLFEVYRRNYTNANDLTKTAFQKEEIYLGRYFEIFYEDGVEYAIFGGDAFLSLLQYYVIVPENDPLGANGYSTKGGPSTPSDVVMTEYVDEQVVSPTALGITGIPNLTTAPTTNLGLPVFARKSYETVLETLQELGAVSNADFKIERTTGVNFEFSVLTIGSDRTKTTNYPFSPFVYFQLQRRNLLSNRLTIDRRKEITQALVQAQGPEEDRIVVRVQSSTSFDSPFNNRYAVTDARNIEDDANLLEGLNTSGNAFLNENAAFRSLTFAIDKNATGARYNLDWFLGDKVSAEYKGFEADYRIVEVEVSASGSEETITPLLEVI